MHVAAATKANIAAAKLKMKFVARIDFQTYEQRRGNRHKDRETDGRPDGGTKHVDYDRNSKMKQFTCIFDTVSHGQLSYTRVAWEQQQQQLQKPLQLQLVSSQPTAY